MEIAPFPLQSILGYMSLDNTFWPTLIFQYSIFSIPILYFVLLNHHLRSMANLTAFDCAYQVSPQNEIDKVGVQRILFPLQFWLSKEKKSRDTDIFNQFRTNVMSSFGMCLFCRAISSLYV